MFLKNDILSMEILSRSLSELQRGKSCRFCGRAEKFDNLSQEFLWVSNELLISAFGQNSVNENVQLLKNVIRKWR